MKDNQYPMEDLDDIASLDSESFEHDAVRGLAQDFQIAQETGTNAHNAVTYNMAGSIEDGQYDSMTDCYLDGSLEDNPTEDEVYEVLHGLQGALTRIGEEVGLDEQTFGNATDLIVNGRQGTEVYQVNHSEAGKPKDLFKGLMNHIDAHEDYDITREDPAMMRKKRELI